MADKTFGFKVSEELHEKVKNMIENSGITSKDWFEKAVALTEVQDLKEGSTDYKQDLSELEVHTTRIYELIANMIKRADYLKYDAVKEVSDQLEERNQLYKELKETFTKKEEELMNSSEKLEASTKENEEMYKQVEEMRATNENNQSLINQYKEKIDTLSGLVSQYKSFQEENERLKDESIKEKQKFQSKVDELMIDIKDKDEELKELSREYTTAKRDHTNELERVNSQKELEREKALLEVERKHQEKLLAVNEEHNKQIKELYTERENMRKEYESKIERLQKELQEKQSENKPKK